MSLMPLLPVSPWELHAEIVTAVSDRDRCRENQTRGNDNGKDPDGRS